VGNTYKHSGIIDTALLFLLLVSLGLAYVKKGKDACFS
jgi:hypothetical protein